MNLKKKKETEQEIWYITTISEVDSDVFKSISDVFKSPYLYIYIYIKRISQWIILRQPRLQNYKW
jgi:hypothetical protein